MKPRTIGGLALMIVGVIIVVYAFLLWNSNFQLSKATDPNFIIDSLKVSVEYIILIILGILAFIGGGLLINKERTIQIMGKLSKNLIDKTS